MSGQQCASCGLRFASLLDYYRHRKHSKNGYTCLPESSFFQAKIRTVAALKNDPDFSRPPSVVAQSKVRRAYVEPPTRAVLDVCWLLRRSYKMQQVFQMGFSARTVDLALQILEQECKN